MYQQTREQTLTTLNFHIYYYSIYYTGSCFVRL